MLMTSSPSLPRLLLSVFLIELTGYWSPTKSILVASPASVRILVITMSASSENLSGTLTSVCSTAIASMMTAVVRSGKFDRNSTPFSSSLERMALFVLANEPSVEANDHGRGPSSCVSRSFRSIWRLCPMTRRRANKFLALIMTFLSPAATDVFFYASRKLLKLINNS